MHNLLKDCIPEDHCRQSSAWKIAGHILANHPDLRDAMDLGCGRGESRAFFLKRNSNLRWVGLDIEGSPEVSQRTAGEGDFRSYDGVHIPFDDASFDLVFSRQAFEHVQYPHDLLKETARVLRPGGYFIGSTSQLEPYHSYSTFGYSPYGWLFLIEEVAGLQLAEIRPGIDAFTLMARRAVGAGWMDRWFESESPPNRLIGIIGRLCGRSNARINVMKLRYAGQFSFIARKDARPV